MKKEKQKTQELVYGVHPIIELLKAKKRKIYTIYTTKHTPKVWSQIAKLLPREVAINYTDKNTLDRIAGTSDHQSVVAWASPLVIRKKFFNSQQAGYLVMLDGVQDPRNLGAILRSCYCTGVQGVIIPSKKSAPLNAVALKSSAGLAEHLDIYQSTTAPAAIQELKQAGYTIYLATIKGQDATQVQFKEPLCMVIGSEDQGVTQSIIKEGISVTLPQRTPEISYNASVAAGILLFMIGSQINKI